MTVASKVKQTLASLKGSQGTLRMYEVQMRNEESKQAVQEAIEATEGIINDLQKRLKVLEFQEPQYKGN